MTVEREDGDRLPCLVLFWRITESGRKASNINGPLLLLSAQHSLFSTHFSPALRAALRMRSNTVGSL